MTSRISVDGTTVTRSIGMETKTINTYSTVTKAAAAVRKIVREYILTLLRLQDPFFTTITWSKNFNNCSCDRTVRGL